MTDDFFIQKSKVVLKKKSINLSQHFISSAFENHYLIQISILHLNINVYKYRK